MFWYKTKFYLRYFYLTTYIWVNCYFGDGKINSASGPKQINKFRNKFEPLTGRCCSCFTVLWVALLLYIWLKLEISIWGKRYFLNFLLKGYDEIGESKTEGGQIYCFMPSSSFLSFDSFNLTVLDGETNIQTFQKEIVYIFNSEMEEYIADNSKEM